MVTVKQVLDSVSTEEICQKMALCYETSYIAEFTQLINRLKDLEPEINESELWVYIKVLRAVGDDYEFAGSFEEHDFTLYYDVCGADSAHDCYSIVGCRHAAFLGYYIADQTLQSFTPAMLMAHLLWEITFLGFDDRD